MCAVSGEVDHSGGGLELRRVRAAYGDALRADHAGKGRASNSRDNALGNKLEELEYHSNGLTGVLVSCDIGQV